MQSWLLVRTISLLPEVGTFQSSPAVSMFIVMLWFTLCCTAHCVLPPILATHICTAVAAAAGPAKATPMPATSTVPDARAASFNFSCIFDLTFRCLRRPGLPRGSRSLRFWDGWPVWLATTPKRRLRTSLTSCTRFSLRYLALSPGFPAPCELVRQFRAVIAPFSLCWSWSFPGSAGMAVGLVVL